MAYYSVIYEEYQKGYLLNTFHNKLHSLKLVEAVLDDFSVSNYELSSNVFIIQDKFRIKKKYNIISHKNNIISKEECKILFMI